MTKRITYIIILFPLLALLVLQYPACRKPYVPDVFVSADNYLVVDGIINTAPGGVTTILLSRTRKITDTVVNIPENGATVAIQSQAGQQYVLHGNGNGNYTSDPLALSLSGKYRISVTVTGGRRYLSDYVTPHPSPAIDSINWIQDTVGVHVFANTHDPANNTHFYRWQYVKTWEYHSQLDAAWGLSGTKIYPLDPLKLLNVCYRTDYSTDILLGNSVPLGSDVINGAPLLTLHHGDSTLRWRMSILVQQYALTSDAYSYWQIIQKNSQQLGTLFDLQPAQLEGNIHAADNPTEPVIGFMSAGSVAEKRIFISRFDIIDWNAAPGGYACIIKATFQDPNDFSHWIYPDTTYAPYYFTSGGGMMVAKKYCLDCRISGGTTDKPSFW